MIRVVIGVHIRTHNPQFDWAVVASSQGGDASEFGAEAPAQDFERQMKAIERQFTYTSDEGKVFMRHRFFIASNEMVVKQHFQRCVCPPYIYIYISLLGHSYI